MKCDNCKTDYLNTYDIVKSEGVKYKVYICPCCDKFQYEPIKNNNIK